MKEEKKKIQNNFIVAAGLLALFILYTVAIMFVDVQPIGPQGSSVGFAEVNQYFHTLFGVNMLLYSITMLMMCIMPTAIMQFHHLISSKRLRNIVNAFCGIYASFMVIGRVLSGVHWFTDIVGGILLSATLVMLYYSTNQLVNSKASRSSQRSR